MRERIHKALGTRKDYSCTERTDDAYRVDCSLGGPLREAVNH